MHAWVHNDKTYIFSVILGVNYHFLDIRALIMHDTHSALIMHDTHSALFELINRS